jgi:hypothetical protein
METSNVNREVIGGPELRPGLPPRALVCDECRAGAHAHPMFGAFSQRRVKCKCSICAMAGQFSFLYLLSVVGLVGSVLLWAVGLVVLAR